MDQRFAVEGVDAFTPLYEAAPVILLAKAEPLFALEEAATGGADMDAVHDMRVASRRLRESMRLLAPLYPGRDFDAWYRRVRRVTRSLGPVRDSDVFIDAFSRLNRSLEAGGRHAVAFFVGYRMGQRVHELAELNHALFGLDLRESRRALAKLARSPRKSDEGKRPLSAFAHAAIAERISAVYGMMPDALDEANIQTQHALRIAFKRLRYAAEMFAPCYAEDFEGVHTTLTAFQDSLGDLHDLHVFLDMVHDPARVEAAHTAGVSADDLAELATILETRAHKTFVQFAKLARQNPAEKLLPALLLPLSRVPERPEPPAEEPAAAAEAPESPAAAPAEPAEIAVEPQVVVEPPPPAVTITDFNGLAIEPPVRIGDEPWAVSGTPHPPEESSA